MRKTLTLGVVSLAVALGAAAPAEAHHIDHAQSAIIGCALVNGTPTIQGRTAYRQFEDYNKPVQTSVFANGQVIYHEWISWAGTDYDHLWSAAVAPGEYDVRYWASWARGTVSDSVPSSGTIHVSCPAPPVVPPVVTPPPTPPPPVPPVPPTPPVCATRCTPAPPHFHCPRIHLIMPNPNTLAGRHGVHDFGGRCSHGRIVSTTLYIRATGPRGGDMRHGRRIVCGTVRLHAKGNTIHNVWLADESIWCHLDAWGTYRLRFVFRVRSHGHVYTCVRVAHFLDHDPHGLPS